MYFWIQISREHFIPITHTMQRQAVSEYSGLPATGGPDSGFYNNNKLVSDRSVEFVCRRSKTLINFYVTNLDTARRRTCFSDEAPDHLPGTRQRKDGGF
ncbi:hypothetical protein QOZ95_004473 [Paenibacillus brasilensis]|uniref:Uncharacterized protein n=1 Tax=Paenibacillus brasilensis TaxID=128574 RepID=A0ABU0L4R1_9BACL|nr:hypothetical protein [Paenibacillus brasilensis]